jgi:hypothetical protein
MMVMPLHIKTHEGVALILEMPPTDRNAKPAMINAVAMPTNDSSIFL